MGIGVLDRVEDRMDGRETREDREPSIDGVVPDEENRFVSASLKLSLCVKPDLTSGDLEAWAKRIEFNERVAIYRISLFLNAVRAGILLHTTDKIARPEDVAGLPAMHVQWYGSKLADVYNRYTRVPPN